MAIEQYDPLQAPDAEAWLALDESERLSLVADYHQREDIDLPSMGTHAAMHVTVENQIALGDATPVREKARQLMAQGLDRHDPVHAIASVLASFVFDLMKGRIPEGQFESRYYAALGRLTAQKWLRSG